MSLPLDGCGEGMMPEIVEKSLELKLLEYEAAAIENRAKIIALEKDVKEKEEECNALKAQNSRLELDLIESNMKNTHNVSESSEVMKMKQESEEILTRAKSIIFEKTKVCKNQELQIEALNAQVTSLKDVVSITKNMLEIRNIEVKHLQDQIDCMNSKVAAEKERQDLIHSKLEKMIRMNSDLKREYETQLCLFNALRERYSERELARNVLHDLHEANQTNGTTNASSSTSTEANGNNSKTSTEANGNNSKTSSTEANGNISKAE